MFSTSGTFFIQQDIDNKYALTNTAFMKKMLSMSKDEYGSLEISLRSPGEALDTKRN
jgi:lipoprotein-releasing system permease protein